MTGREKPPTAVAPTFARQAAARARSPLSLSLSLLLFAVVVFFVGWYVAVHVDRLRGQTWAAEPAWLLAALLSFVLADGLFILLWPLLLLRTAGVRLSLRDSFVACSCSWMGRYLPGKVWFIAGKAVLSAASPGLRGKVGAIATLETLLVQLSGCALGLLLLSFGADAPAPPGSGRWVLLAVFVLLGLVVVHPSVLTRLASPLLVLFRQEPLELRLPYRSIVAFLLLYGVPWVFYGVGVYGVMRAVAPVPLRDLPVLTGAYALGVVAGFVSIFAPAGLGVREAVLGGVLSALYHNPGLVIVTAAMTRLIATAAEAAFFVAALAVRRTRQGVS